MMNVKTKELINCSLHPTGEIIEINNFGRITTKIHAQNYQGIILEAIRFPIKDEIKFNSITHLILHIGYQYKHGKCYIDAETNYCVNIPMELLLTMSTIIKHNEDYLIRISKDIFFKNNDILGIPIPHYDSDNISIYAFIKLDISINCTFILRGYKTQMITWPREIKLIMNKYFPYNFKDTKTIYYNVSEHIIGSFINVNKKLEVISIVLGGYTRYYYNYKIGIPIKEIEKFKYSNTFSETLLSNVPLDLMKIIEEYTIGKYMYWIPFYNIKWNDIVTKYVNSDNKMTIKFYNNYIGKIYFVSEKTLYLW
jgi:hypothetical protein